MTVILPHFTDEESGAQTGQQVTQQINEKPGLKPGLLMPAPSPLLKCFAASHVGWHAQGRVLPTSSMNESLSLRQTRGSFMNPHLGRQSRLRVCQEAQLDSKEFTPSGAQTTTWSGLSHLASCTWAGGRT